jgi:YteA family regulatory protein
MEDTELDQERIAHYRQLLERQKRETLKSISTFKEAEEIGGLKDTLQELSMYDNHPADIGTETFERSKDIGFRDLAQQQLKKINDALERMAEGKYGICEECGKEISEKRLEAMPETTLCCECRRKQDDRVSSSRRPVEEGVIMPPFGGFAEDRLDNEQRVQFDGEDAWQTVEHFGTSSDFENRDEEGGTVEDVEGIAVYRDADGMYYQDFRGKDDEGKARDLDEP